MLHPETRVDLNELELMSVIIIHKLYLGYPLILYRTQKSGYVISKFTMDLLIADWFDVIKSSKTP